MQRGVTRYIVPYVLGLAPALLVILTWSPTGDWSTSKLVLREYSSTIVGTEVFAIVVAMREGLLKALRSWNWSRPAVIALAIVALIAVANLARAPLLLPASVLTTLWFIHALFAVSMVYLLGFLFEPKDLVLAYLVGFITFTALLFVYLTRIPDFAAFGWKNHFLFFGHIRHAGYYLAAMSGLGIGYMAVSRGRLDWSFGFVCTCLAIGIALWTGSRGAVFAVCVALFGGAILVPAFRNVRGIGGGLISLALAAGVVSQLPTYNYLMGFSRMVDQTASGNVTTGRTVMWEIVAKAIGRQPMFGYGEGQMREVATFSVMGQPHNIILQLALAWGLVGLLCVVVLAVAYTRRALPVVRSEAGPVVPAFIAMAALATLSLYDGSLYYALPQSIFAACGALIASSWSSAIPRRATAPMPSPAN